MKQYAVYCLLVFCLLATSTFSIPRRDEAAISVSSHEVIHSTTSVETLYFGEIPLTGFQPETFAYNPANNTLHLIEKKKRIYTIRTLQADNSFSPVKNWWKLSSHSHLDNFVYNSTGGLYACLKSNRSKGAVKQALVFLTKKNRMKKISLQKINQVPATGPDAARKKKGGSTRHRIQDIKFSGTALALTYHNRAVKFYNIVEGQALGASRITGIPNRNSFYNYQYLSVSPKANKTGGQLTRYDIRTGEISGTVSFGDTKNTNKPFYLTNYREQLYLLSDDGLFFGTQEDETLKKAADISELPMSATSQIRFFAAARDDTLYFSCLDDSGRIHLYCLNNALI
ncbi:MAG: hypothetical protein J1F22_07395 [Lachnospiraceae bacterium]|nr:hypothetical protein [Lachnospiraceae bacterium]